jgi:hypothetical protein
MPQASGCTIFPVLQDYVCGGIPGRAGSRGRWLSHGSLHPRAVQPAPGSVHSFGRCPVGSNPAHPVFESLSEVVFMSTEKIWNFCVYWSSTPIFEVTSASCNTWTISSIKRIIARLITTFSSFARTGLLRCSRVQLGAREVQSVQLGTNGCKRMQ